MQWTNSPTRYGVFPQALHWLTALCVIAGWLLGEFMDDIPKGPARAFGLWTHMTLGELVLLFLLLRLVWRFVNPPPPFEPTRFGRLAEIASRVGHIALYLLLVAVPAVGIVVHLKRGHPLPVFGLWDLAPPWPTDRPAAKNLLEVHELLANTLLILAAAHAAAALLHHYALGDRTLARMLPGRS